MSEKERRITEYLEKKRDMERKERKFFSDLDNANKLLKSHNYEGAVQIFKDLIPLSEAMGWIDKKEMLQDLIRDAREKEKRYKMENERKKKSLLLEQKRNALYNEAMALMDDASINYQRRELESALELYKKALNIFKDLHSTRESELVNDSIRKIESELSRMRQLKLSKEKGKGTAIGEIIARETEKARVQEDGIKNAREAMQKKKEEEKRILDEAMGLLDKANEALKRAKGLNFTSVEAKKKRYKEVFSYYEDAAEKLTRINWLDEADRVRETILKVKRDMARELEVLAKRIAKKQKEEEDLKLAQTATAVDSEVDGEKAARLKKQQELRALREKAYAALDDAGNALMEFERSPKVIGNQVFKANKYPEIIRLYRKALGLFKDLGWISEAAKIEESIEIIREKEKNFLAEKELWEQKQQELKRSKEIQKAIEQEIKEKETISKLKRDATIKHRIKKEFEKQQELGEAIDRHLDRGIYYFKKNELVKSEQEYKEAYRIMREIGWAKEAENVLDTIKMIREKINKMEKILIRKERDVDESGAFTRGIEQLSETMELIKKQKSIGEAVEKKKEESEKGEQKKKQEKLIEYLSQAQNYNKQRDYERAIEYFKLALKIAEDLNWTSQIIDIKDFIQLARENLRVADIKGKRMPEHAIERKIDDVAGIKTELKTPKHEDHEGTREVKLISVTGQDAYAILDKANQILKTNKKEAIKVFQQAIDIFKELGWVREIDLVKSQIAKIQQEIQTEESIVQKKKEIEATKKAYDYIDFAGKLIKDGKEEEALKKYEEAIKIFEGAGWTKEAQMIQAQMQKVKEDLDKKQLEITFKNEKEKIDKAFKLMEDARRYKSNRKIFKAVECAYEAWTLVKSLGNEWQKEREQFKAFLDELEKEKREKEDLLKRLRSGNF
ncbi:MAG: hypothetical protein ACTSRA_16875 [Promethearchaeota archaeon]